MPTLTPPEDRSIVLKRLAIVKEKGSQKFERSLLRKNGSAFPIEAIIGITEDGLFQAIVRDITERKAAEEKLYLSEEKFSSAFKMSPAGITITRFKDGKFIDANNSFLDLFEFTRGEVIEHTSTELNMWSIEERKRLLEQQLKTGGLLNFELTAKSKSGKSITILFSSKPIELEEEQCHLTTMIDITERKRIEKALIQSEIKYRAFFENSMDAILLTSPDGGIQAANPAACSMFGCSEEEIITLGRDGIVDVNDSRLPALLKQRVVDRKAKGELTMIRKDGTRFEAELSSALFNDNSGLTQTSMIIRDISERKKTKWS